MDKWVAECIPCKWSTHHDKQDDAIAAAEAHVAAYHANVAPYQRATLKMGHVQQRTVLGADWSTPEQPTPQPQIQPATQVVIMPGVEGNHSEYVKALQAQFEQAKQQL